VSSVNLTMKTIHLTMMIMVNQVVAMHRVGQASATHRVGPVSRANCVKLERLSFDFDYDAVFASVRPSSR
jgi:hypothetical protein